MSEHIFRDGKTYLEYFNDGTIYFDNQQTKKLLRGRTLDDFYELVMFYVLNK